MRLPLITGQFLGQGLDMKQAMAHAYKNQHLAIVAALKTTFYGQEKSTHFLVIQGSTAIGNLSFQCQSGFTYEHSESIRSFQESVAAVVDEDLNNDLLRTEFYSVLTDESTDIGTDHSLVIYMRYVLDG